jgi:hypothetical protein
VAAAVKVNSSESDKAAVEAIRDRLRQAGTSLRDALGGFEVKTNATYATMWAGGTASTGAVSATSARTADFTEQFGRLRTTAAVNTQTAETARRSSSAIGLDVTTAESASQLFSSAALALDLSGTASVKVSKEEMNLGTDGSYSTSSLTFRNGASTSAATGTLTGTYTGQGRADDATSLTVVVTTTGTIGNGGLLGGLSASKVEFDVKDQTGEKIKSISATLNAGQEVYLGDDIGLSISFSAGQLVAGHTSSFNVSKTPITVDPNAAFNAPVASRPRFGAVAQVVAGTFKVNDVTIDVYANDTINTVLNRITNSAAGVTATYSNDKVTLTSKDASDQDISVSNDTSNFVKAVRLDGATTTKGDLRDDQRVLKDTGVFATMTDGSFVVNGVTIAVDKDTDTLSTLLTRITNSAAGVTATLNTATSRIELRGKTNSEDLITLGTDSSRFFEFAKLSAGNGVRGNIRDDQQVLAKTSQFAAVTNGSFTVNGVSISVDKNTDSLSSIVSRINSSGAGVTASYDSATDKLVLTPGNGYLTVTGDTSGFLAAAKMATGSTITSSTANPDAAFNSATSNRPMFDPGLAVTAGSFMVNGVAIAVAADDTINSVLTKITNSAAGVTASYDSTTELVTLVAKSSGGGPITVGGDTSGFLAAVKLNGSAVSDTESRSYSAFTSSLSRMDEYDGVAAGTLTVNGQNVSINPSSTTIRDLIGAIDDLDGVTATVDETSGAIAIYADEAGSELTLADTSGMLEALGIEAGTYGGGKTTAEAMLVQVGTARSTNAGTVGASAENALQALNAVIKDIGGAPGAGQAMTARLRDALQSAVDTLRDQGFRGLSVDEEDGVVRVDLAQDALSNALNVKDADFDAARAVQGLVERLEAAIADAAGWDAPTAPVTQTIAVAETANVQLQADQTMTSLLMMKSALTPQEPKESQFDAALKAYLDGSHS